MDLSSFSKENTSKFRKKMIPWHCQKRYQESLSQISLNNSMSATLYKQKILGLQRNNKCLALALQHKRSWQTEKENLLKEKGRTMDLVYFSKLKLTDMVESMKKAFSCLNETVSMLDSCISGSLSKNIPNNLNYRFEFKNRLQGTNLEPIEEVMETNSENTSSSTQSISPKSESNESKGCKRRRKRHTSAFTKRHKSDVNKNNNTVAKTSKMPGSSNIKSLPNTNPSRKGLQKKCNLVTNKITDEKDAIADDVCKVLLTRCQKEKNTEEHLSKNKNCMQDALSDNTETIKTQASLMSETVDNHYLMSCNALRGGLKHSKNMESLQSLSKKDNLRNGEHIQKSSLLGSVTPSEIKDKFHNCLSKQNAHICVPNIIRVSAYNPDNQSNDVLETNSDKTVSCLNEIDLKQNLENTLPDKSKKYNNFKNRNKVRFYYDDENTIEKIMNSKPKRKPNKKRSIEDYRTVTIPLTVKANKSKKRTLKPILGKLDLDGKINENCFLVTAEIHNPPDNISKEQSSSNEMTTQKMQPSVVLTDIFKSGKTVASEIVNDYPNERGCLKNMPNSNFTPVSNSSSDENDTTEVYFDFKSNAENEKLPFKPTEEKKSRRSHKILSYKEPSLNIKMRRCI